MAIISIMVLCNANVIIENDRRRQGLSSAPVDMEYDNNSIEYSPVDMEYDNNSIEY